MPVFGLLKRSVNMKRGLEIKMAKTHWLRRVSNAGRVRRWVLSVFLVWMIVGGSKTLCSAEPRRVAIMPAVADFEIQSDWRKALSGFDARVQAELLKGWQVEVLSRAGLSTVVFEQKLRAATDPKAPAHRVLPADLVALTVFDFQGKELRLYAVPVGGSMKVGNPTVLRAKSPQDLASALPAEVARILARSGKLSPRREAAAANPKAPPTAQRLVCALLAPVSPEGLLDKSALGLAPLIQAGLEQAVSSGNAGAVQLVERTDMARLIDEKALHAAFGSGMDVNAATQFGRMVKADLIVVPFIHAADKVKIETDVFAVEVSTGRLLDCFSWSGAPGAQIPVEQVAAFLQKASSIARESAGHPVPDNATARHAEAAFLASVPEQWAGLRMREAAKNQAATRMADAALALNADDPALMLKTVQQLISKAIPASFHQHAAAFLPNSEWVQESERIRKSGQYAVLLADARHVFELPLIELQKEPSGEGGFLMASYWNRVGESQKALQVLTAAGKVPGDPADKVSVFYVEVARAYMGLGRYKECAETILRRGQFSRYAMNLLVDAFRADGDEANEFKYLWINRTKLDSDYDRHARVIDLAVKFGKASEALELFADGTFDWARAELIVQLAAIRARIAAGQKEITVSDAQCALINARNEKNGTVAKELEKILASLNAKPLEHLLRAGDFLRLPPDCVIHLIHDQTIAPAHARVVAEHVAAFWGCTVQIWPVKLEARKLSFFQPLAQALDGARLQRLLTDAALPAQRFLGRIFLTHEKLIATQNGAYSADVYSWALPQLTVLSEHYFTKFANLDKRTLPLIDAIVASEMRAVKLATRRHLLSNPDIANHFAPIPPDLFSNNGTLVMNRHELGISPRTAAVFREITWDQIAAELARRDEEAEQQRVDPRDRPIVEDLSRQLQAAKPEIVQPTTPAASKTGAAAGR